MPTIRSASQTRSTLSRRVVRFLLPMLAGLGFVPWGLASDTPETTTVPRRELAKYFGWDEPRIIVVDRNVGPAEAADVNGDGLTDLIVVNNSKSRIELHLQRATPRTEAEITRQYKVNELPPSPFYDRVEISVQHRVSGFRVHDFDGDGKRDIVYVGVPAEIVVLRQSAPLKFETASKRRVKDLAAGHDGVSVANVSAGPEPELITLVGGRIAVFSLAGTELVSEPLMLGSGGSNQQIVAFFTEDYNADARTDILAAIPDDASPVRLWLQEQGPGGGQLGPELRFEMPELRELEPVRLPGRDAAAISIIERASRRLILSDLVTSESTPASRASSSAGERDAAAEVFVFPGPDNKTRSVIAADIDADGLADLLATDQKANTIVMYRQQRGVGLATAGSDASGSQQQLFSALKDPRTIAGGQWDSDPALEVFVLSEADKVVGVAQYDTASHRLGFPQPIALATAGASPVAMAYAALPTGPALAVIARDKRDHTLEIHRPGADSEPVTLKLEGVNRPPQSMLAGDFDHDDKTDLVLFTPAEPLVMVRSIDGPADQMQLLTDKSMPQFGLVQAAGPDNTAMLDIDNDNHAELLVADQNFVRACAFSPDRGWRVVEQITLPEAAASLVGLAVMQDSGGPPTIVASDKANKRLVLMSRDGTTWRVSDRLRFSGFDITSLLAGSFSGDGLPNILAIGETGFATVRTRGTRYALEEFAAFRSDDEDLLEHEIEVGDLNSDGFTDLVVLDAKEQMCQVFTVSAARRLLLATEFKVFESRLFGRGDDREFEPSAAIIADLTGDGRNDIVLQVHDRYVIYPQMGGK